MIDRLTSILCRESRFRNIVSAIFRVMHQY